MAQITMNIPDQHIQRILDAFASAYGWHDGLGVTKAQFAKSKIRDYIKEIVMRAEAPEAQRVAIQTIQTELDSIDIT